MKKAGVVGVLHAGDSQKGENKLQQQLQQTNEKPGQITPRHRSLKWSGTARYASEYSELDLLGKGGFGEVYKVKNNLDGCVYAIKKILLQDKRENKKILREVSALSRLSHKHIVRYYQAWVESGTPLRTKEDSEFFPTLSASPSKFVKAGVPRTGPLSPPSRLVSPPTGERERGRPMVTTSAPIRMPGSAGQSPSPTKSSVSPSPNKSILIGSNRESNEKIMKEHVQNNKNIDIQVSSLHLELEREVQKSIKYSGSWDIREAFGGRNKNENNRSKSINAPGASMFHMNEGVTLHKSWSNMHFLGTELSDSDSQDEDVSQSDEEDGSEGPLANHVDSELGVFGDFEDDEMRATASNHYTSTDSLSFDENSVDKSSDDDEEDNETKSFFNDVNRDLGSDSIWTSKGSNDSLAFSSSPQPKLKRKVTFTDQLPGRRSGSGHGGGDGEEDEDDVDLIKIVCNICDKKYDDWEVSFNDWHLLDVVLRPLNLCPDCYRSQLLLAGFQQVDTIQIRKKEPVPQYLYIQMEYCNRTLKDELESKQLWEKYPPEKIWQLFLQIVSAIAYLHSHDCIHRDLKPGNIFISDGVVKLGDFGLATGPMVLRRAESVKNLFSLTRMSPRTQSRAGAAKDNTSDVGTYLYSSPENKNGSCSVKVDMYSLGIILFELWHPFDTLMERCVLIENLRNKCLLPKGFMEKYSEQTEYILQLVNHNPAARPTAQDLLHKLSIKHKESGSVSRRLNQLSQNTLQQKVEELTVENSHLKNELSASKEAMAAMKAQIEHLQQQLAALSKQ